MTPEPTPIDPTRQLSVTFAAQDWNAIMVELGRAKFTRVARFIMSIQQQCADQVTQGTTEHAASVSRLRPVPDDPPVDGISA